jgi:hypothetical protein
MVALAHHAVVAANILNKCPRELLLLLKTNDILRALSHTLGGDPADVYWITARKCVQGISRQRCALLLVVPSMFV